MRRNSLPLLVIVICVLTHSFSAAQLSTLPAAQAMGELPGPPKNPPIFSTMTMIWQGGLQYQNLADLKGPVASVEREESQSPDQNPNPNHTRAKLKFDDEGHLIEYINEDSLGVSTTSNDWVNGRLQSQMVHHHRNDGKFADWSEWQRWTYDKDGRLSEFHAGRDKQELNDYVNFKYDAKGRPLGYELYAQTLTEISYEGRKITLSRLQKYQRRKFFEQAQIVDDRGRVIDLRVSDLSSGQLKQWYHVRFDYDEKGRVIEQNTDPFKLGSGDDYSPLPGRLIVEYNDEKHSGEQKFYDANSKLAFHATFEYDRDGIPTKLQVLDTSGKERTGAEVFIDHESHKPITRPGNADWEVLYDDHSNWTVRRRWFTPADGSPRIMTRVVRQEITYR